MPFSQANRMDSSESPPLPFDYRKYDSPTANKSPYILSSPSLNEQSFVQQIIDNHPVVVFSKTKCPHCIDTKNILAEKGVAYKAVELDSMANSRGPLVQNVLQDMTSARTVPRIFIAGNCVGGNSDLKTLNATGELEDLLKSLK